MEKRLRGKEHRNRQTPEEANNSIRVQETVRILEGVQNRSWVDCERGSDETC